MMGLEEACHCQTSRITIPDNKEFARLKGDGGIFVRIANSE